MTGDQLTVTLGERVMGWRVGPDHFLMGNRRWLPRWRFQPDERLEVPTASWIERPHRNTASIAPRSWVRVRIASIARSSRLLPGAQYTL